MSYNLGVEECFETLFCLQMYWPDPASSSSLYTTNYESDQIQPSLHKSLYQYSIVSHCSSAAAPKECPCLVKVAEGFLRLFAYFSQGLGDLNQALILQEKYY